MPFNDAPHQSVVHGIIPMNDSVSEIHDGAQLRNALRDRRIEPVNAVQSFADDFKFAFHRTAEKTVRGVFGETFASRVLKNALARFANVKQQLFRRDGHKEVAEQQRQFLENTDFEWSVP